MKKFEKYFTEFNEEIVNRFIEMLEKMVLEPTDIEGVLIVNNSSLFNLKENKYITRNFSKIESIENRQFIVEEKIVEENTQKSEVLMYQINELGKIISPIYSTVSHDWIAWPQENEEFDYDDFLERRRNFLLELFKKEEEIQKSLKKVIYYKIQSEK